MTRPVPATDWVRLELDLDAFEDAVFEPILDASRAAGVTFTTMGRLGDSDEAHRALYELNRACSADIPERSAFPTFEEYLADRIHTPSYDAHGVVLAIDDGLWVGLATTSIHPDEGYAFSEMTGVRAGHRGRDLSLALKLLAIRFARSHGMRRLRTFHHPANTAAIAMNRRLGFTDL